MTGVVSEATVSLSLFLGLLFRFVSKQTEFFDRVRQIASSRGKTETQATWDAILEIQMEKVCGFGTLWGSPCEFGGMHIPIAHK